MSHIVVICHIAVDMSHIAAICHIALDMSNRGKICFYKMKKMLDKRRPIYLLSVVFFDSLQPTK